MPSQAILQASELVLLIVSRREAYVVVPVHSCGVLLVVATQFAEHA